MDLLGDELKHYKVGDLVIPAHKTHITGITSQGYMTVVPAFTVGIITEDLDPASKSHLYKRFKVLFGKHGVVNVYRQSITKKGVNNVN